MIKLQKSTFFNETDTKRRLCNFITKSSMLSMGLECRKFEINFAAKQVRKYAVFVNSGSSANLILIQAFLNLGRLKRGDIVGVSALTWATNIMPLIQLGLQPILIDCEIDSLNVSSKTFKIALDMQPNIRAFFITNTLGHCDDILEISQICANNNILFFEDNCESLGSIANGRLLGNFGVASTFSFFVGHHLSAIEGGMVCTDDEELFSQMLMSRSHGWDRNLEEQKQIELREEFSVNEFYAKYTFYDLAYNVRPTEINGFLGNCQINYWDEIVRKRYDNFLEINTAICSNNELMPLRFAHMDLVSSFAIPVVANSYEAFFKYKEKFISADVEIRPMIAGSMARQPFYRKYIANPGNQPNAELIHSHSFYCGNNPELSTAEIKLLMGLLSK